MCEPDDAIKPCSERLGVAPMGYEKVVEIYHSSDTHGRNIIRTLCLSHERLRAELNGIEIVRNEDEQTIREAVVNLDAGKYREARELLGRLIPRVIAD